eukprot:gnl/Chilomastix_caulleri/569.p1 GENE.gnl/Chilomastix_caulleri/569~~gnl/Chilomastix_caulleri/569.p1  ORF type:complete len:221 (+),score=46.07 gnl/Chilomastix_caulleri/569:101-763(+)
MESQDNEYEAYMFKVIVVGNAAVGKTSCIKRCVYDVFFDEYKGTIGVDFAFKVIQRNDNTQVRLQFWDIAGQERYGNLTHAYYKDSYGAFVVADVSTKPLSNALADAAAWKADIDKKVQFVSSDDKLPCLLLLNKADLLTPEDNIKDEEIKEFSERHGFAGYYLVSAKTDLNLKEACNTLVEVIIDKIKTTGLKKDSEPESDPLKKDTQQTQSGKKGGCC